MRRRFDVACRVGEDYYAFTNVCRSVEDAMQDSFLKSDSSESQLNELSNYCNDNYDPNSEQIDEFRDSTKRNEKFLQILLCPHGLKNQNSFYYAILYAVHYQLKNKKNVYEN